jgi:hypothetical protein
MTKGSNGIIFHQLVITSFRLFMLISALLSTVAGIMALYGAGVNGVGCRPGLEITATALQGTALLSCMIALTIAVCKRFPRGNIYTQSAQTYACCHFGGEGPKDTEVFNGVITLLTNIGGFIMILFILLKNDCGNPSYNAVYSILSIGGTFLSTLITSFVSKTYELVPKPITPNQYPSNHPTAPVNRIRLNMPRNPLVRPRSNTPSWSQL